MKQLAIVFEGLTVARLVTLWISIVIIFSIAFYALSFTDQHLIYNSQSLTKASGLGNAIYFSFITATTIGYGDIAPTGFAKVLAILEAIASIVIFGIFIGKLVSVKQEEIIEEIQELSLEEASNTAISELYLFRSEIKSIQETATKKSNKQAELEDALQNLRYALSRFNNNKITSQSEDKEKTLMRLELISNSINISLSRLVELFETFNRHKIEWKKESTTATIAEVQKIIKTLYEQYNAIKTDEELSKKVEEKLEDLNKTLATLKS